MNRFYIFVVLAVLGLAYAIWSAFGVKQESWREYTFEEDLVSTYSLEFSQRSKLLASDMIKSDVDYTFDISALLHHKVLQKEGGKVLSAFVLSDINITSKGSGTLLAKHLKPYYETPFLVWHKTDGRVISIEFAQESENYSGLAQLVFILEVVLQNERAYQTVQEDATGEYVAFYKRDAKSLAKQKNRYKVVKNPQGGLSVNIGRYEMRAQIADVGNWLESLELYEELSMLDSTKEPFVWTSNRVVLYKTALQGADKIEGDAVSIKNELHRAAKEKKPLARREATKEYLDQASVDFDKVWELFAKSGDVYMLKEYLSVNEAQTYKIKEKILEADDISNMRLLGMLSLVDTQSAREVLCDLATREDTNQITKLRSVIALADMPNIDDKSLGMLLELSLARGDSSLETLSDTALLAMAAHAKNTLYEESITQHLRAEYAAATQTSKEKNVLYAMQNAGIEHFVQDIAPSLASKSKKVRMVALGVLATYKEPQKRMELLQEQLLLQEDENVKMYIEELLKNVL